MEKATHTLYTRWVEVKLADGRVIKGLKKQVTAVQDGKPKPEISPKIAADWARLCSDFGSPVVKVAFRYRRR